MGWTVSAYVLKCLSNRPDLKVGLSSTTYCRSSSKRVIQQKMYRKITTAHSWSLKSSSCNFLRRPSLWADVRVWKLNFRLLTALGRENTLVEVWCTYRWHFGCCLSCIVSNRNVKGMLNVCRSCKKKGHLVPDFFFPVGLAFIPRMLRFVFAVSP